MPHPFANLMDDVSRMYSVGSTAPGLSLVTLLCLVSPSRAPSLPDSPLSAEAAINLSEAHSSDLTSDIFGVASGTLQAAKWWRALGAHHLLPSPAPSFLAAVRHRRSWPLLRELMLTIPLPPLFALLMAPYTSVSLMASHGNTGLQLLASLGSMNSAVSCSWIVFAGMHPGNRAFFVPKSLI